MNTPNFKNQSFGTSQVVQPQPFLTGSKIFVNQEPRPV